MAGIDWAQIRAEVLRDFSLETLPPTLTLPALPLAVTQFNEKSQDPDVDLRDLSKIVETDTGLTVELLRYVNSTAFGRRNPARTALQALTMLGLRNSTILITTTGLKAVVQARQSRLIHQPGFWSGSLQKALFAQEVARLLKADSDVAFAGALMQDYLLPVLTNDLCDDYIQFFDVCSPQVMDLCEFESARFRWDHALAGACLAYRWKLPDDLVCCILFHHHGLPILAHPQLGQSAVAAVALSGLLPDALRQTFRGLDQLLLLQDKWPAFDLLSLAETVDRRMVECGMGVRNDFPLARRCRASGSARDLAEKHALIPG